MGPSVYGFKVKRTRKTKESVLIDELIPIPKTIKEHYMELAIAADVLHVNQIPFFSTIFCGIHYGTIFVLLSMKVNDLKTKALLGVIHSYSLQDFTVKHVLVDIQFECLKPRMFQHNVSVNVVFRDEHVPEIKHFMWVIKERCRACIAMLPFERFPRRLIVGLLKTVVFYINVFFGQVMCRRNSVFLLLLRVLC